jgi:hypothetical protein
MATDDLRGAAPRQLPETVGTIFRLGVPDGDVRELEFPGLGRHFAVGCQVRYPGVVRSFFGVHAETGAVSFARLLDDGSPDRTAANFQRPLFVDSDLDAFADVLRLRLRLIEQSERGQWDPPAAVVDRLLAHATAVWDRDPAALADDSTFWSASIWQLWTELTDAEDVFRRFLGDRRAR